MPAIVAGALSGGAHAVRKKLDAVGVLALAIATGIGGGLLRDILIGMGPPLALARPYYLDVVVGAAIVSFFFSRQVARVAVLLNLFDTLSLGFFAVAGADRALAVGLPIPGVLLCGVLTAVGGSLIRDVLCNDIPDMLVPGQLQATPALLGAIVYVLGVKVVDAPAPLDGLAALAAASALRVLSSWRGWHGPRPLVQGGPPQ
jgi:uncharacterized membrane protein YeiH